MSTKQRAQESRTRQHTLPLRNVGNVGDPTNRTRQHTLPLRSVENVGDPTSPMNPVRIRESVDAQTMRKRRNHQ